VELLDERLSSWEAAQVTGTGKTRDRRSPRKGKTLDDLAAAVILRDYLSRPVRETRG